MKFYATEYLIYNFITFKFKKYIYNFYSNTNNRPKLADFWPILNKKTPPKNTAY